MIILGLSYGHDSGACIISEDGILAAVNEERLSRQKLHIGFPYMAVDEVLKVAKLTLLEIDVIAVEGLDITPQMDIGFDEKTEDWKKNIVEKFGLASFLLGTEAGLYCVRRLSHWTTVNAKRFVERFFRERGFRKSIVYVDHHECHAASAYYTQPFDEGIAITLDASGEGYCSRVYRCKNNRMTLVHKMPCFHSPAYYYAYITKILGFTPLRHEGKVTGLAAFGRSEPVVEILKKYITYDSHHMTFVNHGGYHLHAIKKLTNDLSRFSKEDISAGIQAYCETLTCDFINDLVNRCNNGQPTNLFLAGGLFANVKINQRVLELAKVKSIYVFPNMGDGGLNAGAALSYGFDNGYFMRKMEFNHLYFGRKYSDDEIQAELNEAKVPFYRSSNIAKDVAEIISKGKVVARFNESMEYGPRALGNRSIIYTATDRSINDWLNRRLKRTEFMPFAPFVRDIDFKEYFYIETESLRPYLFMTITCNVTDKCKAEAPAIVHVDGTARPQIISREINPTYYDILTEYKNLTGIGVLVNTSFNMHEEPIINSPAEAIKTLKLGGLDVLAIGNFIVTFENQK